MTGDSKRTRSVLLVGLLATAAVLTTASLAGAHGGDDGKIHACVVDGSGAIRIVSPSQDCRNGETATDWVRDGLAELDAFKAEVETRFDAIEGRTNDLEADAADLSTRVADLEADAEALDGRVGSLEAAAADLDSRVDTLEAAAADLDSRVDDLEAAAEAINNRVTNLGSAPGATDGDRLHTSRLTGQTKATVALDPASIPAGTRAVEAIPMFGLEVGDMVVVSPPADLNASLLFVGYDVQQPLTGDAEVIVYLYNATTFDVDDGFGTWTIQYLDLTP